MKRSLRIMILASALAGSFAATQVATGGTGLPEESGGSATTGEGSHGTGAADTHDTTRGTKGKNEHMRRDQPGNTPTDQRRGAPADENDDDD